MMGKEAKEKMNIAKNITGNSFKEKLLRERASVTLEAAIILPIFYFLFMALNGVFFVFSAQNQVMHTLVQTANSLSLDPYWNEKTSVENLNVSIILQNIERSITQDKSFSSTESWHKNETVSSGVLEDRFYSYFTGDGNKLSAYTKLKKLGVVGNMELSGTVNNGDLTLVAKYKIKFWFNLFKTEPLDLSQKVKVHLWGLEDY